MPISFHIPKRLIKKLELENADFANKVETLVENYSKIPKSNRMCFFPEYTDHGLGHIERVLEIVDKLIPQSSFKIMTSEDVGVLIIAVILHDIGMHTSIDLFNNMINGKYDDICMEEFGDKTWKRLWEDFKFESNYWNKEEKDNYLGEEPRIVVTVKIPNPNDPQKTEEIDKKLVGEFIRRHHHRLAHDIAQKGFLGFEPISYNQGNKNDYLFLRYLDLAGLVARSHGIDMRATFDYLKKKNEGKWAEPLKTHIIYLMALLRLADYLDITNERTNEVKQKIQKMYSPFSRLEHAVHNAICSIEYGERVDKKVISLEVVISDDNEENVKTYVKIKKSIDGFQNELDKSWAVLGEVYGTDFGLQFRRIKINVTDKGFESKYKRLPKLFKICLNDNLIDLLIKPLYSNNPSFGVRELVQNAVDACRECMNSVTSKNGPHVDVKIDTKKRLFTIKDTGKGMTIEEIEKYFLTIGSSYNDDINWKRIRNDEKDIYRTGRFGIGVLASFLLGDKILVETRSRKGESGYKFELSLEDKFIEISKVDNLNYGTKITIKCNESSLRKLTDDVKQYRKSNHYKFSGQNEWFFWYINNEPIVRYYYNYDEIKTDKTEFDRYTELIYDQKEFGAIRFKTNILFAYKSPHIFSNPPCFIYCNGFFITAYSKKRNFTLPHFEVYYPFRIPSLQITDPQNKLPLNLNRSNIDKNTNYDFEEDLAIEVCKDLICQLISINDTRILTLGNFSNFFYLGYDGFAFKNNYTNKILKDKSLIYLPIDVLLIRRFIDENYLNEWYQIFDTNHECIFSFIALDDIKNLSYQLKTYANNNKDTVYHSTSVVKNFYNYKDYHIISSRNKTYNDLINNFIDFIHYKSIYFSFVGISKIIPNTSIDYLDEQEKNVIDKINNVFDNYLQGNPFIPYKVDDRKNRFTNIFKDESLSQLVEYYKEKYNSFNDLQGRTFEEIKK